MTETSDSWDAGPGEQHTDWTGARRGTQGTTCTGKRMQWENKGFSTVLTTWAFIPERWWKQQNQTRTYMRKQWKQKNWIWDMTGICHCKHQRHNRTTWGTWASQTYLERAAHPKSYSKEMQTLWSGPNWPSGWAALVDLQDKLQLQQHETDRGVHCDTMPFRLRTSSKPERERQGRRRKTRAHKLIATKNSWAAI